MGVAFLPGCFHSTATARPSQQAQVSARPDPLKPVPCSTMTTQPSARIFLTPLDLIADSSIIVTVLALCPYPHGRARPPFNMAGRPTKHCGYALAAASISSNLRVSSSSVSAEDSAGAATGAAAGAAFGAAALGAAAVFTKSLAGRKLSMTSLLLV